MIRTSYLLVMACMLLFACKDRVSTSMVAETSSGTDPWLEKLPPISSEKAALFSKAAADVKVAVENVKSKLHPIVWSYNPKDNNENKSFALTYALANIDPTTGQFPKNFHIPTELSLEQARKLVETPNVRTAKIKLLVPSHLTQKIQYKNKVFSKDYDFLFRTGTVLNVKGKLMVLDLTLGPKPFFISEWVSVFFKEDSYLSCSEMSPNDYRSVLNFWNTVIVTGEVEQPTPTPLCGYFIEDPHSITIGPEPGVSNESTTAFEEGTIQFEFHEARVGLNVSYSNARTDYAELNAKIEDLSSLRSSIQPKSISEFCSKADPSVSWGRTCKVFGL